MFQHPGYEFIYMLSGEVTYRHDRSYLLQPGDSLFFDSEAPHGPEELRQLPAACRLSYRCNSVIAVSQIVRSPGGEECAELPGFFLKNESLEGDLGRLASLMLRELCDRGPDSAGFAVYGRAESVTKVSMVSRTVPVDWTATASSVAAIAADVEVEEIEDAPSSAPRARRHRAKMADRQRARRLCAEPGPRNRDLQGSETRRKSSAALALDSAGTHAIGHTRMATGPLSTVAGSHPVLDRRQITCLVHNGSLSNHRHLREQLVRHGERFQTDNDNEVAAPIWHGAHCARAIR